MAGKEEVLDESWVEEKTLEPRWLSCHEPSSGSDIVRVRDEIG